MTTLHSCCHCHQYCYSHRSSLSKLQFACVGLKSSVWAHADPCSQACLLAERLQPRCLIHSPVSEHLLVSALVLGPGGGGADKAQLCPDDGPGGGTAEGLRVLSRMPLPSPAHRLHPREGARPSAEGAEVELGPCPSRPGTHCFSLPPALSFHTWGGAHHVLLITPRTPRFHGQ